MRGIARNRHSIVFFVEGSEKQPRGQRAGSARGRHVTSAAAMFIGREPRKTFRTVSFSPPLSLPSRATNA